MNDPRLSRRGFVGLGMQAAGGLIVASSPLQATTLARTGSDGSASLMLTADTPWVVAENQPEALQRAIDDVRRDWYKVFGHAPVIVSSLPATWSEPAIYFSRELDAPGARVAPLTGRESFSLDVRSAEGGRKVIAATGADVRGAIYATYAFSEHVLGVDPWWFWADKEPGCRASIELSADFKVSAESPTFKWRGWFINDEDLVSRFSPDPLRENMYSLEMLDRICEALLRLRGNMIVPASNTLPDERCHELVARRGLALNIHHVDVVGLVTLRWPKDVPFSYSQHPEIMERYWQECIDVLKNQEVVWTVGFRGKNDEPFWKVEPGFDTPEARGGLISRAIAKQVEMIRKVQPDASIMTNLWWEGATLYSQGFIKIPAGVTKVWPDNGAGMLRDSGKVEAGDGLYYHTMMFDGMANQLSEFIPPLRIYQEIGRFIRAGATDFLLVNVSDIRPVPLSTECAMRLASDARPYLAKSDTVNQNEFLLDWNRRQFGARAGSRVAALCADYFSIFDQQPKVMLADALNMPDNKDFVEGFGTVPRGDNAPHTYMWLLSKEALPLLQSKSTPPDKLLAQIKDDLAFASTNCDHFAPLLARAEGLLGEIPADRRSFYQSYILTEIGINLHSSKMLQYYCRALLSFSAGDSKRAASELEQAMAASEALVTTLQAAETGKWAGWYQGEALDGVDYGHDLIRQAQFALRGEPLPPSRRQFESFLDSLRYQERFAKNFPLLYPPK